MDWTDELERLHALNDAARKDADPGAWLQESENLAYELADHADKILAALKAGWSLAARGLPTDPEYGECFYCYQYQEGSNHKGNRHADDCPWPPFVAAFTDK